MALVSGDFTSQPGASKAQAVPAPRRGDGAWTVSHPGVTIAAAQEETLRVSSSMPSDDAAVLHAKGDIVEGNAQRLKMLVLTWVRSRVSTVVLDLTEVSFLSVAGLQVLATMKQCATLNRTQFVLVSGSNPAVVRPLRAAAVAGAQILAVHQNPV